MTEQRQKIRVPGYEAAQAKKAERDGALGELRSWLDEEHARALEAEPYGSFKMRLPLDALNALSPDEREKMHAHEEISFKRQQERAQAKDRKRSAWIAAGGDKESFEVRWRERGEREDLEQRAAEIETRAWGPY